MIRCFKAELTHSTPSSVIFMHLSYFNWYYLVLTILPREVKRDAFCFSKIFQILANVSDACIVKIWVTWKINIILWDRFYFSNAEEKVSFVNSHLLLSTIFFKSRVMYASELGYSFKNYIVSYFITESTEKFEFLLGVTSVKVVILSGMGCAGKFRRIWPARCLWTNSFETWYQMSIKVVSYLWRLAFAFWRC